MAIKDLIPWHRRRGEKERALVPFEEEVRDLFRETFEDFFRPWLARGRRRGLPAMLKFAPDVDVKETEEEYTITADVPGLEKDDLEVTAGDGRITISGKKKEEKEEKGEDYLRMERSYGSFRRTIPLPSSVEENAIDASFKNGVLTVHVPKTEEARGRKVEVKSE